MPILLGLILVGALLVTMTRQPAKAGEPAPVEGPPQRKWPVPPLPPPQPPPVRPKLCAWAESKEVSLLTAKSYLDLENTWADVTMYSALWEALREAEKEYLCYLMAKRAKELKKGEVVVIRPWLE